MGLPFYCQVVASYLPNLSFITEPAKTEDMIFISSQSLGGEEDFRCQFFKNVSLPPVKAMGHQVCWTAPIISAYSHPRHLQGL